MFTHPSPTRPAGKNGPYRTVRISEATAIELLLTKTPDVTAITPAVWSGFYK